VTQRRQRVVVDTDPGVDDLLALALAARSPELDLVAVTTSYGNASLSATTRNAREVLRLAGRSDVPVIPGAAAPLRRTASTAPIRHGPEGAGDAAVPPAHAVVPNPRALAQVLQRQPEPIIVVTMGPLTNLAAALAGAPERMAPRIARHVGIFGAVRHGAGGPARADFNTWCDPEAADQVIRAQLPTTMIALDASRRMMLAEDVVQRARRSTDPLASWLGAALSCALRSDRSERGIDGVLVHDVLTIATLLAPRVIRAETIPVRVSLDAGETRGHTREGADGTPTAVAVDVDVDGVMALLARVLPARP